MTVENNVPEMSRHLRQIVDNSFEEGQFESAIAMLDTLRSPVHKPSIIHILHLIFIALHPTKETQLNEEEQHLDHKSLLKQSPRKIVKHTKASLILSSSAVLSAQQLLMSLLSSNAPQVLGEALPCYPESKNEAPMEFPVNESMIFAQATAIKHSKNCWEVLKSSFKARTTHLLSSPKPKGKRGSSRLRFVEPSYADLNGYGGEEEDVKVVADNSWFLLEWIVTLFEKDAAVMERTGNKKYSPLLLKQLPPPPIDSTVRWDASEPLKVVFYAFQQQDLRRQRSGARLLNLLVNLTQTPHLNLPSFVSTVLAQLTTPPSPRTTASSPISPSPPSTQDQFTTLFKHLPSTPPALSFRLALCKKMIEDVADPSGSSSSSSRRPSYTGIGNGTNPTKGAFASGKVSAGTRSKGSTTSAAVATEPKRAQPRARVRILSAEGSTASIDGQNDSPAITRSLSGSNNPTVTGTTNNSLSPTFVARCPSYLDVIQLSQTIVPFFTFSFPQQSQPSHLSSRFSNKPWASLPLLTRVKFELLLAYMLVQLHRRELAPDPNISLRNRNNSNSALDPPDASFNQSLADGSFAALLDEVFAPLGSNDDEEMVLFRDLLSGIVGLPPDVDAVME